MKRFLILLILCLLAFAGTAVAEKTTAYFFHGVGCPHCADMEEFLLEMEDKYPDLDIKAFEIYYDSDNQLLLDDMRARLNVTMMGVPTFFISNTAVVGFDQSMGAQLEDQIAYCVENGCPVPDSDPALGYVIATGTSLDSTHTGSSGLAIFIFALFVILVIAATIMIIYISKQQKK